METLSLAEVPRALKTITGGQSVSYQTLYRHVIDGNLAADRDGRGRWRVRREDLAKYADFFGLPVEGA